MGTIKDMIKRLDRLDIRLIAADSMIATKKDYLEWQHEQLFTGTDKKGKKITPSYAPSTKKIKVKKGQPIDRVTLKDTEKFYASIFLVVISGSGVYRTISSDTKSKWLLSKYGENILGLGGVCKLGYMNDLRPVWKSKVESVLKLKFGN